MRSFALLCAALLSVILSGGFTQASSVSFYGASFISLPLQEAKKSTEISFRLKTYRPDALLLLAAGETDYCLIILQGGALRVRINLGAGESELSSPPRLRLNDLLWHEVRLKRETAQVTLTVDGIHVTRQTLPGRFHELNIHHGLFLGGLGDFNDLFLGLLENYRGCLDQIIYNAVDIVEEIKNAPGTVDMYAVDWHCAEEFDAKADVAISFVKQDAYIAFDRPFDRTGGSIDFELKTQAENSLLLYNSGPPSKSDFVALEIVDKRLRLVIDKGNGPIDLNSTLLASDGQWHKVEARFSPSHLEIGLDDRIKSKSTFETESKFLDLSGFLFIGGVEVNKKARAVQQGTFNGGKSLSGCIKNLRVNEKALGIRDPRVTHGIKTKCQWAYPCLKSPCIEGATCVQEGTDGFKCECELPLCIRQDFTTGYSVFTRTTLPSNMELISVSPLEVQEGGIEPITTQQLQIMLEYEKFGVRESGVIFHVHSSPKNGKLKVEIWGRSEESAFTLLDVTQKRVRYIHDGSETTEDSMILELEFITQSGYILPSYLQVRHRFVLPVTVVPTNDPPSISLPPGQVLKLPIGTKVTLSKNIFNATDPDTASGMLKYTILNLKDGLMQSLENPGTPIKTFTQEDINLALISYFHKGDKDSQIIFRVSDGDNDTPNVILRVAAFELKAFLINNTGLSMAHRTYALISSANLSFSSNAINNDIDINYLITDPPRYGSVQRLENAKRWQTVNQFSDLQVERGKIRYEHTTKSPDFDEFRFRIIVGEKEFPTQYTFRISFVSLSVEIIKNADLLIDRITESFISESFLRSTTKPSHSPPEDIVYTLVSTPHYGSIFLSSGDLSRHTRLRASSNFTQEDIAKGRIKYKLHHKTYSQFHDAFEFIVSSKGQHSDLEIFNIRYKPPHLDAIVRVEDLDVTEGATEVITETNLKIHKDGLQFLVYNVTSPPKHGSLLKIEKGVSIGSQKNIQQFTSDDVQLGLLYYKHDDSETLEDNFYFVAFGKDPTIDFQYVGVLHFNILLKNDNAPKRRMEKVFNVVTNDQRMVTSNDLTYYDPDLNTSPKKILYTATTIQNGEFFNISDKSKPIFSFTQEDIDQGFLFFRHKGAIYSEAYISVSDGTLSTPGILEIVASDPFVEIFINSGILVPRGGFAHITSGNLSVETNLNAWGKAITYRLIKGPLNGKLKVQGKMGALHFTEYDLQNNGLEYHHDGDPKIKDEFKFRVNIGEMYTEGIFEIRIFPESYWEPLSIIANSTVKVEEHSEVTVDESSLLIMHPSIPPSDITYMVMQRPQFGKLQIDKKLLPQKLRDVVDQYYEDDFEEEIDYTEYAFKNDDFRFTQAMVNEGRVRYEHTSSNLTTDYMIFDVTNGITSIQGLYLIFQVIPKTVYVTAGSVEVDEGSKSTLSSSLITILSPYYRDRLDSLLLSQPPRHGLLQRSTNPGTDLVAFSPVELEKGLIQYVHDGSEVERDAFSLVAVSDRRESSPVRVSITVNKVNDQSPEVVRNEELHLWEGETVPITSQILAVYDEDTLPQFIQYKVSSPDCGFLSILPNLSQIVTNFTQEDIDENKLYFTHTGPLTGKIRWKASDGQHNTAIHFTPIIAKSLHLRILRNHPLYVFPMLQKELSLDHLLVTTNAGVSQRSIVYTVKRAPRLGSILLRDARGLMRIATNFTQRNINESEVFYQHLKPFHKLHSKDFFVFDVKTPFAEPLTNQNFEIHITISGKKGGELEKYLKLDPLRVIEGGSVSLYRRNVNLNSVADFLLGYTGAGYSVELNTKFLKPPNHGYLEVRGKNATRDTTLSAFDFEQGAISYHHDGSDTIFDQIPINVYLIESTLSSSDILLYNGSLNVSIIPVNDQPFKLVTDTPGMTVVRGQKALIKRTNLLTEDADNVPNEIMYEIMKGPDFGTLVLSDNFSISLHSFTQGDINKERVLYIHDGSNSTATFYFQVSDGKHEPKYDVFTIKLESLELTLVNHTTISLKQASTISLITSHHLAAFTNGDIALIYHNITRFPKFGKIYVNELPVSGFSQLNIDRGKVVYIQEDLGASEDSFTVEISIYDQVISNVQTRIIVRPLLESKPLPAIVGGRTRISLQHLNATKLADITGSMPIYRLNRLPRLGRVKKITKRAKRSGRSLQIREFTHDDIRTGRIFYVARKIRLRPGELQHDVIHYTLTAPAPDVQPAQGSLTIKLLTSLLEDAAEGRQLRPGIPPEERTPASPSRPHPAITETTTVNSDYFMLAAIVAGILLVTVMIIFIIRCSTQRRVSKGAIGSNIEVVPGNTMDIDVASLPPPICTDSRPNSFMTEDFSELEDPRLSPLETSPRPTRLNPHAVGNGMTLSARISDSEVSWPREISRDVSPSVPQCKVTPLCPEPSCQSPCQSPYQPPPSIAGYPYGADSEQVEEWSMYETQPLRANNPMLRKNQYWV